MNTPPSFRISERLPLSDLLLRFPHQNFPHPPGSLCPLAFPASLPARQLGRLKDQILLALQDPEVDSGHRVGVVRHGPNCTHNLLRPAKFVSTIVSTFERRAR